MASNIVLPSLTNWTKNHITALVQATTEADLDKALDAFLIKDAQIFVNGEKISRDQYKSLWQGTKFEQTHADLTFKGDVEVNSEDINAAVVGSVGLFYTAVISEAIVIHDSPVQRQLVSSINVVIEKDPSLPSGPPGGTRGGAFDPRRVKALGQVITPASA